MANIPVIDISPSNPEAAKQLLTAAEGNGFLFVEANAATGITAGEIDDMFALVRFLSFCLFHNKGLVLIFGLIE